VSVYLDASVLVALLMVDAQTARAVARRARIGDITPDEARKGCSAFDMVVRAMVQKETVAADIKAAGAFLRRVDLTLN
jgi:hypothetical protein